MLFKREPVLFATLVRATVLLATAFGLQLDPTQIGAIVLFTEALLAFMVRGKVSPASTAPVPADPHPAVAG